jgi:HK97 family phage major capsid protein
MVSMTTNPKVDVLNDRRLRAHYAARDVLQRAEEEGRDLSGEERAAVARADAIIDASRQLRDDIVWHDDAIRTLEGVGDEFRRLYVAPTYDETRTLNAFNPRNELGFGGVTELDLDLAAAERAFRAYRGGARGLELRAFTSDTSSATGGSLILPLDVSLNVYAALTAASAMRHTRATVITTSGGAAMRFPNTTTQAAATQLADQTTSFGGTDPALGVMTLNAFDAVELISISADMIEDAGIDLLAWIGTATGTALGKLTGQWYATGTGSGQPTGLANAGAVGAAGTIASGGSLILGPAGAVGEKLVDLLHSTDPQYRTNSEWVMHDATGQTIRKLRDGAGGTAGAFLLQMVPTPNTPFGVTDYLLGHPIRYDSNIATMGSAATPIFVGDMSAFYIRDVRGLRLTRSDNYAFNKRQSVVRAMMRTDSNLIDATAVNRLHMAVT